MRFHYFLLLERKNASEILLCNTSISIVELRWTRWRWRRVFVCLLGQFNKGSRIFGKVYRYLNFQSYRRRTSTSHSHPPILTTAKMTTPSRLYHSAAVSILNARICHHHHYHHSNNSNKRRRLVVAAQSSTVNSSSDPYKVLNVPRGSSFTEIRASYYKKIKLLHPDVNPDKDTTDQAVALNAAYTVLFQEYSRSNGITGTALRDDVIVDMDVFDLPTVDATELFINPFACYNINPLMWRELQEVGRTAVDNGDDPEEVLRRQGVVLDESSAIHYVTPDQYTTLIEEFERLGAVSDVLALQACSFYITDCLFRARWANLRRPGP